MRVIAAFIVLAAHYSTISGLTSGISLFFVITGFLSGAKIKRAVAAGEKLNFLPDLRSTVWRLLLPMHIVLFALAIWIATSVDVIHRSDWLKSVFAMSLGYGNYYEISNATSYWERSSILSPSISMWAMSVLVQFAFILAVVRYVASRVALKMTKQARELALITFGLIAIALGIFDALLFDGSTSYHFATTTWIWAFLLGLVLGGMNWRYGATKIQSRIADVAFGVLLVLGILPVFGIEPLGTWVRPAFGLLAAICLLAPSTEQAIFQKVLNHNYVQWVGGITFGIYLIHWPLLIIFRYYTDANQDRKVPQAVLARLHQDPNQITWYYGIGLTLLSIALAWLMQKLADRVVGLVDKLQKNTQIFTQFGVLALLPLLIVVTNNVPISNDDSLSQLLPPIADAAKDSPTYKYLDCQTGVVQICGTGIKETDVQIVIVGTSTAGQWYDAVISTADQYNWQVNTMTKEGCTHPDRTYEKFCDTWREEVVRILKEMKPDLVIMETTHATEDQRHEQISKKDQKILKPLNAAGIPVMGIRATPRFSFFVPECIASNENYQDVCGTETSSFFFTDSEYEKEVNFGQFVELVDLTDVICPNGFCAPVDSNIIRYVDDKHFTATYAKTLDDELKPYLVKVLGN